MNMKEGRKEGRLCMEGIQLFDVNNGLISGGNRLKKGAQAFGPPSSINCFGF
jgi:hypothetical protein